MRGQWSKDSASNTWLIPCRRRRRPLFPVLYRLHAAGDHVEDDGVERQPSIDQDGDHAAHPARVHDVVVES